MCYCQVLQEPIAAVIKASEIAGEEECSLEVDPTRLGELGEEELAARLSTQQAALSEMVVIALTSILGMQARGRTACLPHGFRSSLQWCAP